MKKQLYLTGLLITMLTACNENNELALNTVNQEQGNIEMASYMAENYPGTEVVSWQLSKGQTAVTINTGETVTFDSKGTFLSYQNNLLNGLCVDSIFHDSLSTNATPDHHHFGKNDNGHHGNPNALNDSIKRKWKKKHGHDKHFKNELAIDSLPEVVNEYLVTNYSGYSIIHAQTDTICSGTVTQVLVCTSNVEPIKLVFDATYTYIYKSERSDISNLPANILESIQQNYPDYKPRKRMNIITQTDNTLQYQVFIELNKAKKMLIYQFDGNLICEK